MTLASLYPPIALATVLNVVLLAFAWRVTRDLKTRPTGPWYFSLTAAVYLGSLALFAGSVKDRTLSGPTDHLFAALIGELIGAAVVYSLVEAFIRTRGKPWRERVVPAVFSLGAIALMLAALFGS